MFLQDSKAKEYSKGKFRFGECAFFLVDLIYQHQIHPIGVVIVGQ